MDNDIGVLRNKRKQKYEAARWAVNEIKQYLDSGLDDYANALGIHEKGAGAPAIPLGDCLDLYLENARGNFEEAWCHAQAMCEDQFTWDDIAQTQRDLFLEKMSY